MFNKRSFRNVLLVFGILFVFWGSQQAAAQDRYSFNLTSDDSAPVIGRPFNISTESIDEVLPAVAYNPVDQEYLVVWQNRHPLANDDIYAQRIDEQGKFISWFYVADGEDPAVAYNPTNNTYLVVYTKWASTDYDVYARRVDFTGFLGAEFPIAFNLNDTEHSPAVAYNTHPNFDEFLVVWENIPPPPTIINKVEGWRVAGTAGGGDAGGETIGSRLAIANNSNYNTEPDIAYNLNMNEYLIVYTLLPGGGGSYDVYGRRVTGNGVLLTETSIDSSGGDQYNPTVAAYRLNQATPYLVVFTDTWNDTAGDVRGYLVNQQGQPMQLINIAATPGQREFDPVIAESEGWGGYFVSWIQGPTSNTDIFGMQVSNTGLTYPEFDISGSATTPLVCDRTLPDIAVGNLSALAVWTDPCGSAGGQDILGRMLGYRVSLPLIVR